MGAKPSESLNLPERLNGLEELAVNRPPAPRKRKDDTTYISGLAYNFEL
jgi:hypothetical protein